MPPEKPRTSSKPQLPKTRLIFRRAIVKRKHHDWPDRPVPILIAFTETDEACPFVILNGDNAIAEVASRASALYLAKTEALKCLTIIQFLKDLAATKDDPNEDNLINRALFDSAVVWYSKLYIDSDAGRIKLEGRKVYQRHPEYLALHNKIIEIRHKAIAHQTGRFEGVIPYVALMPDEENKDIIELYYDVVYPKFFDDKLLDSFLEMAHTTARQIDAMIIRAEARVLKEADKMGLDYLYSRAMKLYPGGKKEKGDQITIEENPVANNFATFVRHHS
ncbi:hypothetical protein [Acidithiobacillus ferrooxidans]|uniref:hypothetical protein n=1 Tax=Acidithiobacillus ferrooxidans TaxID=920 RepID=UPI000A63076D|nr:hypothetical protein [Acidithiobacillus ferrooxidans]MCR1344069.1 hypothetical protein [Acidithiobacillus ferrooxidans]QLK41284.1 hypothetical protein FE661_03225 [Acidithiobacillus ferrooxidans]QZT53225.1 hypothetical protein K7B00_03220 [Acidithiobacillus ferrooxidans]BDB13318.1 hypothetical protein ANFP_06380 [Acidithiobacillus ferrooxidans]